MGTPTQNTINIETDDNPNFEKSAGGASGLTGGASSSFLRENYDVLKALMKEHKREERQVKEVERLNQEESRRKKFSSKRILRYEEDDSSSGEEEEDDDLSAPYQSDFCSKFTKRIANFGFPPRTKMPSIVKTYDGSGDPDDHLSTFAGAAETELWSMPVWCRMFAQTLVGPARVWFQALDPGSIDSFKELEAKFEAFFTQQKRYLKGPTDVHKTKQKDGEGFKDFVERWKKEMLQIKGASETMKISGFMQAIRPPTLIESLNARVPDTVDEMMVRVKEFIKGKEASGRMEELGGGKFGGGQGSVWRPSTPAYRSPQGKKPFGSPSRERRHISNRPRDSFSHQFSNHQPLEGRKYVHFTSLTKTPAQILATEFAKVGFAPPPPLQGTPEKGNLDKYCDFHADRGHSTNDCYLLKKQIEEAVKSGKLAHLVRDIRGRQAGNSKNQ